MIVWDIINCLFGLGVTVCATYKLLWYYDNFNPAERAGLGLMAGSVLMTLPPLVSGPPTPFDDWSPAVLRIGVFLFLAARVWRLVKHDRANRAFLAQAQDWVRGRHDHR